MKSYKKNYFTKSQGILPIVHPKQQFKSIIQMKKQYQSMIKKELDALSQLQNQQLQQQAKWEQKMLRKQAIIIPFILNQPIKIFKEEKSENQFIDCFKVLKIYNMSKNFKKFLSKLQNVKKQRMKIRGSRYFYQKKLIETNFMLWKQDVLEKLQRKYKQIREYYYDRLLPKFFKGWRKYSLEKKIKNQEKSTNYSNKRLMKSKFIIWKSESFKSIKTKDMKAIEFNKASIKQRYFRQWLLIVKQEIDNRYNECRIYYDRKILLKYCKIWQRNIQSIIQQRAIKQILQINVKEDLFTERSPILKQKHKNQQAIFIPKSDEVIEKIRSQQQQIEKKKRQLLLRQQLLLQKQKQQESKQKLLLIRLNQQQQKKQYQILKRNEQLKRRQQQILKKQNEIYIKQKQFMQRAKKIQRQREIQRLRNQQIKNELENKLKIKKQEQQKIKILEIKKIQEMKKKQLVFVHKQIQFIHEVCNVRQTNTVGTQINTKQMEQDDYNLFDYQQSDKQMPIRNEDNGQQYDNSQSIEQQEDYNNNDTNNFVSQNKNESYVNEQKQQQNNEQISQQNYNLYKQQDIFEQNQPQQSEYEQNLNSKIDIQDKSKGEQNLQNIEIIQQKQLLNKILDDIPNEQNEQLNPNFIHYFLSNNNQIQSQQQFQQQIDNFNIQFNFKIFIRKLKQYKEDKDNNKFILQYNKRKLLVRYYKNWKNKILFQSYFNQDLNLIQRQNIIKIILLRKSLNIMRNIYKQKIKNTQIKQNIKILFNMIKKVKGKKFINILNLLKQKSNRIQIRQMRRILFYRIINKSNNKILQKKLIINKYNILCKKIKQNNFKYFYRLNKILKLNRQQIISNIIQIKSILFKRFTQGFNKIQQQKIQKQQRQQLIIYSLQKYNKKLKKKVFEGIRSLGQSKYNQDLKLKCFKGLKIYSDQKKMLRKCLQLQKLTQQKDYTYYPITQQQHDKFQQYLHA